MKDLIALRRRLHAFPELSGKEIETSDIIARFLSLCNPDTIIRNVGGHGVLAVFDSRRHGNNVLFRADIDALPVHEQSFLEYNSMNPGVSHKCGHDGHTAILAGFAEYLKSNRPEKGKLYLLFQPAEETGEGALKAITELDFHDLEYAFALHNLPGYGLNSILLKEGTFAAASKGIIIRLHGRSSHASEPEKGVSPANALASLIRVLPQFTRTGPQSPEYTMVTVVHATLGEPAFGTTPGEAMLMATLRGSSDESIMQLAEIIKAEVSELATFNNLSFEVSYSDEFPATVNDKDAIDIVRKAAISAGHETRILDEPFRWSEDFGHFNRLCKSALFGLGAGSDHLPLHNPAYDFPDEIIPAGVEMWKAIYKQLFS